MEREQWILFRGFCDPFFGRFQLGPVTVGGWVDSNVEFWRPGWLGQATEVPPTFRAVAAFEPCPFNLSTGPISEVT